MRTDPADYASGSSTSAVDFTSTMPSWLESVSTTRTSGMPHSVTSRFSTTSASK
jgi:hypothetical protein